MNSLFLTPEIDLYIENMGGVVMYDDDHFNSLPEDCISTIILFLNTPQALCRAMPISSAFRSLANLNMAWDRFLPSDYQKILSSSVSPVQFSSSKQLYFHLCGSILIDRGKKIFWLDASTGKKCYKLSARDLSITWGNEPMYWSWKSIPQSRFSEVAELRTVCWLQINGKISSSLLSRNKTYAAYLLVKFANRAYGLDKIPAEVTVEVGNYVSKGNVYLRGKDGQQQLLDGSFDLSMDSTRQVNLRSSTRVVKGDGLSRIPVERKDGWMEIELGEFFIGDGEDEGEVKMSLMEIKGEHLKGGLIVEGIEVRPKLVNG